MIHHDHFVGKDVYYWPDLSPHPVADGIHEHFLLFTPDIIIQYYIKNIRLYSPTGVLNRLQNTPLTNSQAWYLKQAIGQTLYFHHIPHCDSTHKKIDTSLPGYHNYIGVRGRPQSIILP